MSHYNSDPAMCRVSFFKQSGKWYTDEEIRFVSWSRSTPIHNAFRQALANSFNDNYLGMQAVCLEPYHEMSHPISIIWDGQRKEVNT